MRRAYCSGPRVSGGRTMKPKKKIGFAGKPKPKPRRQWWKASGQIPADVVASYTGQPSGFENDRVQDYEWPHATSNQLLDPVFPIIEKADRTGNIGPVLDYIQNTPLTTQAARDLVFDFL